MLGEIGTLELFLNKALTISFLSTRYQMKSSAAAEKSEPPLQHRDSHPSFPEISSAAAEKGGRSLQHRDLHPSFPEIISVI